jgi:integrase
MGIIGGLVRFNASIQSEPKLVPHSLRTTANTILLDLGANPTKVRAAMGWAQEDVQRGYTNATLFDLDEMSAKMATDPTSDRLPLGSGSCA